MMKPIVAASLFALTVPLMAQTSTNDDQGAVGGNATNAVQDQPKVMAPAQNPTLTTPDTDDEENDSETTDDASVAVTDTATTTQVDTTAATQVPIGDTTDPAATSTSMSGRSAADTGMGGPFQPARDYPICPRTIT